MTRVLRIILVAFLWALIGCGAGGSKSGSQLGDSIGVPNIPPVAVSTTPLGVNFKPYVFLDEVKDNRQADEIININGQRKVDIRGDISLVVHYALRQTFRKRGFTVTDTAPVIISGSVKKWIAKVKEGQTTCEAVFAVDVLDPTNQSIYSSTYDGFSYFPATSDKIKIKQALGQAMADALKQVIEDKHLIEIITSF